MKRANRTHTEEFDAVTKAEPELEAFQAELLAWERVYNATGPTRPWATSFPPNTSSRWGSMCNVPNQFTRLRSQQRSGTVLGNERR